MIDEKLLKNEELAVYKLRSLYSKYGYMQYKMSKFEEYDLYVRNKDFLLSDRVITFTDTNGQLLALKPDVTLAIINHLGNSSDVQKLYYNENVYRVSGESHRFKEIMQTGLECVGDIGIYEVCEVTSLAIQSLNMISESYKLDISHAGLVSLIIKENNFDDAVVDLVREYISLKNEGAINSLLSSGKINSIQAEVASLLTKDYASIEDVEKAITVNSDEAKNAFNEFKSVLNTLKALGYYDKISINFSLANNMRYYSGIVFKGYVEGIPTGVLSGGQYDSLMKKLKKRASAIGFAVYLDGFERLNLKKSDYDVDCVLITKGESPEEVLKARERLSEGGLKVLVANTLPEKITYKKAVDVNGKELV
ncbi:MAG: ATP phosphoribosyltransferase regulatory subunit [Clostridia bacterium]|jgi:ATP phosphoribosyltransferase regulatory subunit|nr:ATP phosphoribosyltransferase regulatory subunit [Clostridia bacterium]